MCTGTTGTEYSILECPPISNPYLTDRTTKWKCSNVELAPNCPRCASTNTKFCYYNNYSLSQPRYFCKGCRRYWTKGGSLRNVPVGGGCRKSRRARASRIGGPHSNHTVSAAGLTDDPERGTCIDLAAVFAKYVNPNAGNEGSSVSAGDSSGSLDIDSQIEDAAMYKYQQVVPMDLINGGDDQVHQVVPGFFSVQQEMDGQGILYQDLNGLEWQQQRVIGEEEMGVDVLWPEGTSSFDSQVQPVMQVQDFGLFSPDDQFRISADLVADNWGSFDLPAFEF